MDRLYDDPDPSYYLVAKAYVDELHDQRVRLNAEVAAAAKLSGG